MNEENNSKKISDVVIFILIVTALIMILMIMMAVNDIEDGIESLNSNDSNISYLQMDQSSIEDRLEEIEKKIDAQSSDIEDVKITFGECDVKNGMGKINVTVVPKEYEKNTKITVGVGEYNTELKLKNKKFIGTIETPYTEIYDNFFVSIETKGKVKNEKIIVSEMSEDLGNWEYELPYRVDGEADYDITDEEDTTNLLKIKNVSFSVKEIERNESVPVIYLAKNNKIIFQQEMKYDEKSGKYRCDVKETFRGDKKDKYDFYADYIGKSGLIYRVRYFTLKYDEENEYIINTREDEEDNSSVYGSDGKEIKFKYMDEDDNE